LSPHLGGHYTYIKYVYFRHSQAMLAKIDEVILWYNRGKSETKDNFGM